MVDEWETVQAQASHI